MTSRMPAPAPPDARPAAPGAFRLRFSGALSALAPVERGLLLDRLGQRDEETRARAAEIVSRVRREGDSALFAMARELDGVTLERLEVPRACWRRALDSLDPPLVQAMTRAARNISAAHRAFLPRAVETETEPGVMVGRRPDPLARVGVYAPGGRATYPSSVLMCAVPARVAGVREIILCSPPEKTGEPSPMLLAAAEIAGVDRLFAIGGAGAIAAMAYGTETVPRVERIVGPGNAYVASAKLQVVGQVSIDSPAGPSELLVIADASADPEGVAREMAAQAEHDPDARVVAVATSADAAERIESALARHVDSQPRSEIIARSLAAHGGVLVAETLDQAIEFANLYAPEHLLLAVADPDAWLPRVRHAGAVFLGLSSSVAFGDYLSGANHTLPTGGAARSYSGLSTLDFVRWTAYQRVAPEAATRLAGDTEVFAAAERLFAHAEVARAWGSGAETLPAPPPRPALAIARAAYREIAPYAPTPDRSPCAIDLSDNTNLFGVPPAARRALLEPPDGAIARYPAPYADDLKTALARYAAVERDEIVTGCGSDDVIDSAIRAFSEPGERIAFPAPCFAMLPAFARMNGLRPVLVPLRDDLDLDAEAMLATGARVIYLCSPNNPTGTLLSRAAVERVVREGPGLVILDEAYAEFSGDRYIEAAPREERLLVTRTLSKAFGLAGLRIGYAAGSASLVAEVEKSRGPFKVAGLAERAAVAALTEDLEWVRARIAEVVMIRARFIEALRGFGLGPLPSAANFVLVPVDDAPRIAAELRRGGVAVRPFPGLPRIGDAVRITIGPWSMMEAALARLGEISR